WAGPPVRRHRRGAPRGTASGSGASGAPRDESPQRDSKSSFVRRAPCALGTPRPPSRVMTPDATGAAGVPFEQIAGGRDHPAQLLYFTTPSVTADGRTLVVARED